MAIRIVRSRRSITFFLVAICSLFLFEPRSVLAFCPGAHDTCEDMRWCMFTNPWPKGPDNTLNMQKLQDAAKAGNNSEIWAWTNRCQYDLRHGDSYEAWQRASAGCASISAEEWGPNLAREALRAGRDGHCSGSSCLPDGANCDVDGACCSKKCHERTSKCVQPF